MRKYKIIMMKQLIFLGMLAYSISVNAQSVKGNSNSFISIIKNTKSDFLPQTVIDKGNSYLRYLTINESGFVFIHGNVKANFLTRYFRRKYLFNKSDLSAIKGVWHITGDTLKLYASSTGGYIEAQQPMQFFKKRNKLFYIPNEFLLSKTYLKKIRKPWQTGDRKF